MHVDDRFTMRAEQRAKPRTHSGRIEDDVTPLLQRPLEPVMQFLEHALAAAPCFARERKPHVIGTQVQRAALGGDARCECGFAGSYRAGYREDKSQDS